MPCTQIHSHYAAAVTLAAIGYTHHQWMDGWVEIDRTEHVVLVLEVSLWHELHT